MTACALSAGVETDGPPSLGAAMYLERHFFTFPIDSYRRIAGNSDISPLPPFANA